MAFSPNNGKTLLGTFEQQRKNVTGMRFALSKEHRASTGRFPVCGFGWNKSGSEELTEYEVRSGFRGRESLLQ